MDQYKCVIMMILVTIAIVAARTVSKDAARSWTTVIRHYNFAYRGNQCICDTDCNEQQSNTQFQIHYTEIRYFAKRQIDSAQIKYIYDIWLQQSIRHRQCLALTVMSV